MPEHPQRASEPTDRHFFDGERPRSRTAAAGVEFLKALAGDLAALAVWLLPLLATGGIRLVRGLPARFAALRAGTASMVSGGRVVRRLVLGIVLAGIGGALVIACAMLWALYGVPLDGPAKAPAKATLVLEAADGQSLGRIGAFQVADARLQDFPPVLIKAVLSTEDRHFFDHHGVDPLGILRAAHANRVADGIVEGGSTITQQLVKLEYLDSNRTYSRKLREALIAIWLETHLSKDEILTRYLNRVYLGDGAYGMAAAARLYFNKRPADLTLAEAAMLAGLIKAPSDFDPLRHLAAAQARAATVLDAMVANNAIDKKTADAAKTRPATVNAPPGLAQAASWFADWVAKGAAQLAGAQTGTVVVRTTLRPDLQHLAQRILDDTLATQGRRLGVSEGALVAMRADGAVLAMVGGRDYRKSQFNRAVDAKRQPGSLFKLFVYLAALRRGYTPNDTIDAGPIDVKGWQPANFDDEHYGRLSLAGAFAHSVNTAAVRLAMQVGLPNVVAAARDLGITEPLPQVPSLALGSAGVSLLDLTGAFASVLEDRLPVRPWGVAAIGAADGSRMLATVPPLAAGRTLDPYRTPLIELLQGVVEYGTGRAAALDGDFTAGKTGTSQDYRDAWFIGFDDRLVVGVWVGNDDDSPMRQVVGGSLPAAIWKRFMTAATPLVGRPAAHMSLAPDDGRAVQSGAALDAAAEGSSQGPGAGSCDYEACARFYHSFRAADCTYQPFDGGPRQLCEK
jgi:1A family penicillin-binding protein